MTDALVIPLNTAARLLGLSNDALRMRGRRGQFPLLSDEQGRLVVRTDGPFGSFVFNAASASAADDYHRDAPIPARSFVRRLREIRNFIHGS